MTFEILPEPYMTAPPAGGPGWSGQSISVTLSTKMTQECREKRAQLIDGKSSVWLTRQSR